MRRHQAVVAAVVAGAMIATALPAAASQSFDDVEFGSTFQRDIESLAWEGITRGCNPPDNTRFCPDDAVTRGQMAAFLVRALGLTDTGDTDFTDDDGSVFETDIERLAAAGITLGCNPPDNTRFCPDEAVTRGQLAAFLVRGLGLTDTGDTDFTDDDGSVFETDIERLAAAGITLGCNPPDNTRFCPFESVTREQMAAFLVRAFDYAPSPLLSARANGTWNVTYRVTDTEGRPSTNVGDTRTQQWTVTYDCAEGLCDALLERGGGQIEVDVDSDTGLHVIRDFTGRLDCIEDGTGNVLFVDGYDTTIFEAFWVSGFAGGGAAELGGTFELEAFARPAAEDRGCRPYELEVATISGAN